VAKNKGISAIRPKMAGCNQKVFIFGCFSQRLFQTMSNAKAVPIACIGAVIIKHPLVPVSPACNWGQGPVLESILPFMGFRQ
jgi:hypothetical protein